jgi:DNA phosphorothioation-associated putative methyltransferase
MVATDAIQGIRYEDLISNLPYGKVLPSAIYLHRGTEVCSAGPVGKLLRSLAQIHQVGDDFNVVKFRTNVPRISFLCYPEFFETPHPVLEESVSIDLISGKSLRMGYRDNLNPPILHRKELFLSRDHPQWSLFAALSAHEKRAGLFANSSLIGFRLNWERLLRSRGLTFDGHQLVGHEGDIANGKAEPASAVSLRVERHRTALTRYDLSKPVKTLLEFDQLEAGCSFFDYGCGLGADVRALKELGYDASGWDPVHAPDGLRAPADVVNLGYVLNVIEDPAERVETLMNAWRLARRLLVVSALIGNLATSAPDAVPLNDGVLTRRNTFQRYFSQKELQQFIEDALDVPAVPVAVGIFYVFSDPVVHESFVQSRSRRKVVWKDLGIDFGTPRQFRDLDQARERTKQPPKPRFDPVNTHRELVEQFRSCVLNLGRLPLREFALHSELCQLFGSAKRALRYVLKVDGTDLFTRAEAARRADLLVYLAIAPLRRIVPFSSLPGSVQHDIHTFFGNYKSALREGGALLHSAGDSNNIGLACDDTEIGWQDERSLYVHTSMLDRIPTVLRTLVACAESLYGNALDADIVRIHKRSFKVTFLAYASFSSSLLPRLVQRARVNLRTQQVDVFDHARDGQLLYFKERFVSFDGQENPELKALSILLLQLGVSEEAFLGPSAAALAALLKSAGHENLIKLLELE